MASAGPTLALRPTLGLGLGFSSDDLRPRAWQESGGTRDGDSQHTPLCPLCADVSGGGMAACSFTGSGVRAKDWPPRCTPSLALGCLGDTADSIVRTH